MFPLSSSERALQNEEFKKGYKKCCDIIDSFSKNDPVMGHIVPECFELFFNSMAENDLPEAAANIIWLLFLNWSQIIDKNMIDALISIIYPRRNKPAANKVILKERSNVSDEVIRKQKEFVEDLDDMAMEFTWEGGFYGYLCLLWMFIKRGGSYSAVGGWR